MTAPDILDVQDKLMKIADFVRCIWLAGPSLLKDECDAIQTTATAALDGLASVQQTLASAHEGAARAG